MAGALLLFSCTAHLRVIRYGYPGVDDYRIFVNDTIRKAGSPFRLPASGRWAPHLDTLRLRHPIHRNLIPFPEYLAQTQTKACIIIHHDTLVYEQYLDGYSDSAIHCTFSVSKSILSVLAGAAIRAYPEIRTDTPVTAYIPELAARHPYFQKLTLDDLLAMRSGLAYSTFRSWTDVFCDNNLMYYTPDQQRYISRSDFQSLPGAHRQYKSHDPVLLAWALERATRQHLSGFFSAAVWQQIGAEYDAYWSTDERNGLVKAASSFHCTAIDLAKIGLLYAHEGQWNGAEVIPRDWIRRTTGTEQLRRAAPVLDTWWQPAQSCFWWFSTLEPVGDYYADGHRGQFLYINPHTRTVIVKFSDASDELHDMPFRMVSESLAGWTGN